MLFKCEGGRRLFFKVRKTIKGEREITKTMSRMQGDYKRGSKNLKVVKIKTKRTLHLSGGITLQ